MNGATTTVGRRRRFNQAMAEMHYQLRLLLQRSFHQHHQLQYQLHLQLKQHHQLPLLR